MRRRLFESGMLCAMAVAVTLWSSSLALSAGDLPTKDAPAPPRTPQTGIDPGIRVDPGPSPDPHTAVPPKSNPDPGMAINPDAGPGARPKSGLSPEGKPLPDVRPPDGAPETRPDPKKQQQ
jgi:hypothetical protein